MKKYHSLKKYFSFHGRAKRSEYWAVFFISSIFLLFSSLISDYENFNILIFFLVVIFNISAIWLGIATAVRRLRDAGINMWFLLLNLVPIVNVIVGIYWGCVKSKK